MIQRGVLTCKQLQPPSACPVIPGCSTGRCSLMIGFPSCFQRGTLQKTSAYPTLGGKGTSSSTQKVSLGCDTTYISHIYIMYTYIVVPRRGNFVWWYDSCNCLMMCFYLALCMEKLGAGLRQVGCQWVFLKRSTRIQTARDSENDEASPNHILEIVLRLPGTTRNLMEIQGKFNGKIYGISKNSEYLHGFPPTSKTLLLWSIWIPQKFGWEFPAKFPRHQ